MPQVQPLVLTDEVAASHTFTPAFNNGERTTFIDYAVGVGRVHPTLTISQKLYKSRVSTKIMLRYPNIETDTETSLPFINGWVTVGDDVFLKSDKQVPDSVVQRAVALWTSFTDHSDFADVQLGRAYYS